MHRLGFFGVFALGCGLAAMPASALEHVTLRSGFTYDCTRLEPAADGRTRLYLDAASSYIDLPSAEIERVEDLPDSPPAAAVVTTATAAMPSVRELLAAAGSEHNIDVDLLASVVAAESGGRASAVSRTGAQGLMQLMPSTARSLGVQNAFAPDQNIHGGSAYLDSLLTRFHDNLALALAAYNAGPAAVDRFHGIPPFAETRAYVARVMREFKRRKLLASRSLSTTALATR